MLTPQRKEQLLYLTQKLIRTPSLSGQEEQIARHIAITAQALGYDRVDKDEYGNIVMRMQFSNRGKKLLFHAQMDHVTPGDSANWSFYPYSAEISNGRIYGSGSMDQKSNLAAMILADAWLKKDAQRFSHHLQGELVIAAAVQQERFDVLATRAIASSVHPEASIIGGASNLELVRGQPGRAKLELKTLGTMGHVLSPRLGINAAEKMLSVLDLIKRRYIPPWDPFLGESSLVLTELATSPTALEKVIPDICRATYVKRALLGETALDCRHQIYQLVAPLIRKNPDLQLSIAVATTSGRCYTDTALSTEQFVPAWVLPVDHPLISNVQSWLSKAGLPCSLSKKSGFGTSGALYASEQNIPSLIYGCSDPERAHRVDEYADVEQLFQVCHGYQAIAEGFLSASL